MSKISQQVATSGILVWVVCFILAGCSSGDGDSPSCRDVAYAYTHDEVDAETGLRLLPTITEYNDSHALIPFSAMVTEYKDLASCAGYPTTPGPTVNFTSFNYFGFRLELALYYYAIQTVYIDTDEEDWLPTRSCISDREFLRHEYMHHVLYLNGEDDQHTNPKFASCSALGPKSCNGEYCEK